jgi:hypothetical protein
MADGSKIAEMQRLAYSVQLRCEQSAVTVEQISGLAESMKATLDEIGRNLLVRAAEDTVQKCADVMDALTATQRAVTALQLSIGRADQ